MDPLTFEAVTKNPDLIQAVLLQARRERSEAVYRLIVEPVKRLFAPSPAKPHAAGHRNARPAAVA